MFAMLSIPALRPTLTTRAVVFRPLAQSLRCTAGTLLLTAGLAPTAHATTYVITDTADEVSPNFSCTLREALTAVRDRVTVDNCPAGTASNTIELGFGTYIFDQGSFEVPNSAAPLDLEITGLNGTLVATRVELDDSNGFLIIVGGGTFGDPDTAHHLRIADVQIQNAAVDGAGAVFLNGSGSLELHNASFTQGSCASDCSFAAAGVSVSGAADATITDSVFFDHEGPAPALYLRPAATANVSIANTRVTQGSAGLSLIGDENANVVIDGLEVDQLGTDAPIGTPMSFILNDATTATVNNLSVHDNIADFVPTYTRLTGSATATFEGHAFDRNQGANAGALLLEAEDDSVAMLLSLQAHNNTTSENGNTNISAAISLNIRENADLEWVGGIVRNNFTAAPGPGASAGLGSNVAVGGRALVDRVTFIGNRHVVPASQANTTQANLSCSDSGSTSILRNGLLADAPGLGINADTFNGGEAHLVQLTIAGNEQSVVFRAGNDPLAAESFFASNVVFGNVLNAPDLQGSEITSPGNLASDPLFRDAANSDYRLQPGSPAIDAGFVLPVDVGNGDFDLVGGPRFLAGSLPPGAGPPDAGAYEFDPALVFDDGFESGDTTNWTSQLP